MKDLFHGTVNGLAERMDACVEQRWRMALASGLTIWGIWFAYDIPGALSKPLQEYLGFTGDQYAYLVSAMYTAYAVPNFILPLISGFVVQRYGQNRLLAISIATAVLGQFLFAIGVQAEWSSVMILGRVLLGIGGETPGVITTNIITRWFRDSRLALALAVLIGMGKLGSIANLIITPRLTEAYGVVPATWLIVLIATSVSIAGMLYLVIMDTAAPEKKHGPLPSYKESINKLPHTFWWLAVINFAAAGCYGFSNSAQRFLASRFYHGDQAAAGLALSMPQILSLSLMIPFGFLLEHGRFKRYPIPLLFASSLLLMSHILFLVQVGGPIIPLLLLGVSSAAHSVSFWPAVASSIFHNAKSEPRLQVPLLEDELIVEGNDLEMEGEEPSVLLDEAPEHLLNNTSTASRTVQDDDLVVIGYGIMTSLLNMGLGVVPVFLSVMEIWDGYIGLEMVFAALASVDVFVSARLLRTWK